MNYAYIRVSSDKQTTENQRDMIEQRGYKIDKWLCDESVSGTVDWHKRDIEKAVMNGSSGDRIIVAEISRIGRSLKQVLEIVELCQEKKITIICIREGIELSDYNPMTKMILSILGSLAEMERNLISERTKDALAYKRKQGIVLGRPKGTGGRERCKLCGKEDLIKQMLSEGMSRTVIARELGVNRSTLCNYISDYMKEINDVEFFHHKELVGSQYFIYNKEGKLVKRMMATKNNTKALEDIPTTVTHKCIICGEEKLYGLGMCQQCYARSWAQKNKEHCKELRENRKLKSKLKEKIEELYKEMKQKEKK